MRPATRWAGAGRLFEMSAAIEAAELALCRVWAPEMSLIPPGLILALWVLTRLPPDPGGVLGRGHKGPAVPRTVQGVEIHLV